MEFEGKVRSVEKRGIDGMGVESGGDGWRRGSRENGNGERKWSWKGAERSWGKWNVIRRGDQACEDRQRGRLGEGPERF